MKIFIGGAKDAGKFIRRWPEVEFVFAMESESPATWVRKAVKCELHLVYQHRMKHKHTEALAKQGITPYFTDSTPIIMGVIEEALGANDRGKIHELLAMWSGT